MKAPLLARIDKIWNIILLSILPERGAFVKQQIYMDHAATTRMSEDVLAFMLPYLGRKFGNPSSVYDLGADNKMALEEARSKIAKVLLCNPSAIYFTSGGTESDNWAIIGAAESQATRGRHIITTSIEHHAVLETCHYLENRGFEVTYLPVDRLGRITAKEVKRALRPDTILVSIMTANNEIGTVEPIREIGAVLKNHPALFHTDAVQAFGQIPLEPVIWGVDLLSASAHKFYGPKGIGFMYLREGITFPSFMHGGKQEQGHRAGTENVPAIAGMGEAARLASLSLEQKGKEESRLRDYMIYRMEREIPYCRLNGPRTGRLPGNVNVSFDYADGESVVILLDMEGISCSSGSACTSGESGTSHVLQGIQLAQNLAKGSVRFTLGKETTKQDVDQTVDKCKEVLARFRKLNPAYTSL